MVLWASFRQKETGRYRKKFVIKVGIQLYDFNLLNFLNEQESFSNTGTLFEHLVDESATITYAQRLWDFFVVFCV